MQGVACHSKSRAIHAESLGQGRIVGHKEWKTRRKKVEGHCTEDSIYSSLDMKLLKSFKPDMRWKKGKSLNEYLRMFTALWEKHQGKVHVCSCH